MTLLSRRGFLASASALAGLTLAGRPGSAAPLVLQAKPSTLSLMKGQPAAKVWGYNGQVPGPVIRAAQGSRLDVRFENRLPQPSTIHWHGIRIENAMDGAAGLTQEAVPPGESFDYSFTLPDAGTFWYHPHMRSWEQVARGLYGLLIVEEAEPTPFDRDLALVADDWRLTEEGQIDEASFGSMRDWSHAGRLGNWLTVNGQSQPDFAVRAGDWVRLRFVNTATARVLNFRIEGHPVQVVALDGQPVAPYQPADDKIVLPPGGRCDLAVYMTEDPGHVAEILEVSHDEALLAARLAYGADRAPPRRADLSVALPANPLPETLDLSGALRVPLVMTGGAMGRMESAVFRGETLGIRDLVRQHGQAWAFNGVAGRTEDPLFEAGRGRTVVLDLVNDTRWPHAIHLHGHHAQEIRRNGEVPAVTAWRDTILLERDERVQAAFAADNPGKWMLHCHMLEHQAAGMATWFKVL